MMDVECIALIVGVNLKIQRKNQVYLNMLMHMYLASGTVTVPNTQEIANPNNRKNITIKNVCPLY